jgi:GLPGLI family protein
MKKLLITMGLAIGLSANVGAQGIKVIYVERIATPANVRELPSEIRAAVEAQLEGRSKTMCLYSHRGESYYSSIQSTSNAVPQQDNISVQTIQMGGGATVYKNQNDRQLVSQEYILDRQFLITEELNTPVWEIETAEKTIMGYKCKKAVDNTGVVAWYCPDIPVNDGPGVYFGLPGLIMEVEMQAKTIVAQEVDMRYDTSQDIKRPGVGRAVTREEFNELRTKKMEEMGLGRGGSGVRIIRM